MEMQRNPGWTRLFVLTLALGMMGLLAACGSDATTTTATLTFQATGAPGATGLSTRMADLGNGVTVDPLRLGASQIELERDMAVEEENSGVEFEGSFIVDLIAGTIQDTATGGTTTALTDVLPDGSFEELEIVLTPLAGVGADATPTAMYAAGGYTSTANANEVRTYTITVTVPLKVEVEGPQGILLDGSADNLIVAFRLDAFLSEANLDTLISDGTITSSPGPGAYAILIDSLPDATAFAQMLHDSLEFGEDHDGNHDLDEAEDVDDDSMM